MLCIDRDEIINHLSECSKLVQRKVKTRHDWVGKVIHRKLCQKFDPTTKWYMHKPESVLENEMHKILWDFEIQTEHLIPARRPDLVIINKKKREPAIQMGKRLKIKEDERRDLDFSRKLKKLWNIKVMMIPIVICTLGTVSKGLVSRLEELEIEE